MALRQSDHVLATHGDRVILHKLVLNDEKPYLWRIVLDVDCDPPKVVTAYKTSKVKKYLTEH